MQCICREERGNVIRMKDVKCLWGFESLIQKMKQRRAESHSGATSDLSIQRYRDAERQSWTPGCFHSWFILVKGGMHPQSSWIMIPIVMGCDQSSRSLKLLLLSPRRQRSCVNSHLAESTSANSIASNPPSVSLPYGEAAECTQEEVRMTCWQSAVSFENVHSHNDMYACTEANSSVAAHAHVWGPRRRNTYSHSSAKKNK